MLVVKSLRCGHGGGVMVEDASLEVGEGEIAVVLGPNGSGKTVLLRTIAGALKPLSGSIVFNGVDITGLDVKQRIRMGIRYFPDRDSVFRNLSVEDNLRLVRKNYSLEIYEPLKNRLKTKAGNLSGGELKILTLAMAFNSDAKLVLIDEPSSGLFPAVKKSVGEIILRIRDRGVSFLVAEQDLGMSLSIADRIYLMESGIIRGVFRKEEASPEKIREILRSF